MTLLSKAISLSLAALVCFQSVAHAAPTSAQLTSLATRDTNKPVTWDDYSLMIDGERVFFWGGEFHPFRLPNEAMQMDVLEKIKSAGFNVVQSYFHWGFHSWKEGTIDFTGIRDVEAYIKMVQEAGLYLSARPGPYINAETTAGGYALWAKTVNGTSRTAEPGWTAAWKPYITEMAKLFKKYEYPNGPIIMVQVDNEYWTDQDTGREFMAEVEKVYKDAGIVVPLFHNAANNGQSPFSSGVGAVDILGYDFYPIGWGPCRANISDWSQPYSTPYPAYVKYMDGVPGAYDQWGGNGEDKCRQSSNYEYLRVYDRWSLAMGVTMQSIYMEYGGTNYGNLRFPVDYTSYDYGAPIDESRQIGWKIYEQKLLNYFLGVANDLTMTDVYVAKTSNSIVRDDVRLNPKTKSEFHILRHDDKTSSADSSFSIVVGNKTTVPQEAGTHIRLNGRDSKILSANLDFLDQHLVYSTTDVLTWGKIDKTDFLVLHGIAGEDGEVVVNVPAGSKPKVSFIGGKKGKVTSSNDQLRLNYVVDGLTLIQITNTDKPLTVLVGDMETAYQLWRVDTAHGPAFVLGPYLVRGLDDNSSTTLSLRGDTNTTTPIEIFASSEFRKVSWNGKKVSTTTSSYGSLKGRVAGPRSVSVPKLTEWTVGYEAHEKLPTFDDSEWTVANRMKTNNSLAPPKGEPVLYSDDYGFHVGHRWYRGHFNATGSEKQLNVTVQGGANSVYAAWLNGDYLGAFNSTTSATYDLIDLPASALQSNGDNVISILLDDMGSDEEWPVDQFKAYRGLRSASLLASSAKATGAKITWKLQGNLGGEDIVDTARGTFNTGGFFGERKGWHLPGFPATHKNKFTTGVKLPHNFGEAGVAWYMTDFKLDFPSGSDNPVVVVFDKPKGDQKYRVEFYVNGWNYGKVIPDLGPQFEFPVPPGILNTNGKNHLAIAVHGLNAKDNTFAPVHLKVLNSYTYGGKQWKQVPAPSFDAKIYGTSSSA
ncbi:glycoside hydrolase superfamily [Gongronella butleri]|nr:glycoside hydrolase superfamily [Gongronella butleri]